MPLTTMAIWIINCHFDWHTSFCPHLFAHFTIIVYYAGDLRYIWKDINKIIDSLHIKNHVDTKCKEKYSPEDIKKQHPTYNTMVCEQTFAWLSRYKKIVSAMPKVHHHFYIHRMVKKRNEYISYCYNNGRRPIHSIKNK